MTIDRPVDPRESFDDDGREVSQAGGESTDAEIDEALAPLDRATTGQELPAHIQRLEDIARGRVPISPFSVRIGEESGPEFLSLSPEEEGRWRRALDDFIAEVRKNYRATLPDFLNVDHINPPRCDPGRLEGLLRDLQNATKHYSLKVGDELLTFWSGGITAKSSDIVTEIKDGMVTIESFMNPGSGDTKTRTIPLRAARVLAWLHRDVFRAGVFTPGALPLLDPPKK